MTKNTIILFFRMIIMMFISFYSSRLILKTLGVSDFGVYNIVGGIVSLVNIMSAGFSNSAQRFISISIGKGDIDDKRKTFVTIVNIHILLVIISFVLLESIGLWYVNNKLNIPINRMNDAKIVFQFSILTILINLISIPYMALIRSYERFDFFAMITIFEGLIKLLSIIFLSKMKSNVLVDYAIFQFLIAVLIRLIYGKFARKNYMEAKYSFLLFDKSIFMNIFNFSIWAYLGNLSGIIKEQGLDLMINSFFGVNINAAKAIAGQVNNSVSSLSLNVSSAVNPVITKSYGAGKIETSLKSVKEGTKLISLLYLLFFIPIFIEIEFLLKIWLVKYPSDCIPIVRILLSVSFYKVIMQPITTLFLAVGNIKSSQIFSFIFVLVGIVLMYNLFLMKFSFYSAFYVVSILDLFDIIYVLYLIHKFINFDAKSFIFSVQLKIVVAMFFAFLIPYYVHFNLPNSGLRLFLVFISSVPSVVISMFFWVADRHEKEKLFDLYFTYKSRIFKFIR